MVGRTLSLVEKRIGAPGPKRLLALDGGGIRGLVTLGYLARIEAILRERYGKPDLVLSDYFDLIGGTSTGAIIATLLALGHPTDRVRDLYSRMGGEAFRTKAGWLGRLASLHRPRYSGASLEKALISEFGERTLDSPDLRTVLAIVTVRADTGSVWTLVNSPEQPFFEMNRHLRLWEVLRASTAVPTLYPPIIFHDVGQGERAAFIDGAVGGHANAALQLLIVAATKGFGLRWPLGENQLLLCSVGTGSSAWRSTPEKIADLSNLGWATVAANQMLNASSELNQTVLQWISRSLTALKIDRQIGNLDDEFLGPGPLISYLRYNISLDPDTLRRVGVECDRLQATRLWNMTRVGNIPLLDRIGRAAAEAQVRDEHFPAGFDRAPTR